MYWSTSLFPTLPPFVVTLDPVSLSPPHERRLRRLFSLACSLFSFPPTIGAAGTCSHQIVVAASREVPTFFHLRSPPFSTCCIVRLAPFLSPSLSTNCTSFSLWISTPRGTELIVSLKVRQRSPPSTRTRSFLPLFCEFRTPYPLLSPSKGSGEAREQPSRD